MFGLYLRFVFVLISMAAGKSFVTNGFRGADIIFDGSHGRCPSAPLPSFIIWCLFAPNIAAFGFRFLTFDYVVHLQVIIISRRFE